MIYDILVIGAGAAGIFSALAAKEKNLKLKVAVLEKSAVALSKVKISGGGRCNVTHHLFDPLQLVKNYPRGEKELLGPFHAFQAKDTVEWFSKRAVELKAEEDGRMFPITDSSQTIIDCLLNEAAKLGIEIRYREKILKIEKKENTFYIQLEDGKALITHKVILATGSSAQGHQFAKDLGHIIFRPTPSLFTFNVPSSSLLELSGTSVQKVKVTLSGTKFSQTAPILITHFGFSGPAIIKLSAWGANYLFERNYHCPFTINWAPEETWESLYEKLITLKKEHPTKTLVSENILKLPKSLWKHFIEQTSIEANVQFSNLSLKSLTALSKKICLDTYLIEGKTTNKEEFVTCGGVSLKEINFKTMESKLCPGLFFAGEILNIDGVTGGFNFQNAWSTGFLAGKGAGALEV
jgi:predicted Rossmann fold flavoprotein